MYCSYNRCDVILILFDGTVYLSSVPPFILLQYIPFVLFQYVDSSHRSIHFISLSVSEDVRVAIVNAVIVSIESSSLRNSTSTSHPTLTVDCSSCTNTDRHQIQAAIRPIDSGTIVSTNMCPKNHKSLLVALPSKTIRLDTTLS